jgi:hypothetical protein
MTLQRDNVAMIRIMRKDRLVGGVTLAGWRVVSRLCKLMFLRQHYDIIKQDFFNPMKDQNIQRKKYGSVLHHCNNLEVYCASTGPI